MNESDFLILTWELENAYPDTILAFYGLIIRLERVTSNLVWKFTDEICQTNDQLMLLSRKNGKSWEINFFISERPYDKP